MNVLSMCRVFPPSFKPCGTSSQTCPEVRLIGPSVSTQQTVMTVNVTPTKVQAWVLTASLEGWWDVWHEARGVACGFYRNNTDI